MRIFPSLIILSALLIFIFQNLGSAKITFVTLSGTMPLALALLVAAALGGLLVLVLGSIRIAQLRKLVHSHKNPVTDNDDSRKG
ncbi:MAG: lipopolysaccharide assembly protein LapA domain-containing protein [Actinomycetota bacterium]|nr:lipopolysaccharide assembly protein LapA domain-containing protein [Actinomycetota bacterium]